jgi:hypothetical protein
MVLIWRGWGIVVVGIAFVALFIGGALGAVIGARWLVPGSGIFLILGGVATWYLGRRMNANTTRQLVDPKTGQAVVIRRDHSLFFIKVEWWGPIMAAVGLVFFVAGLLSPGTTKP